MDKSRQRRVLEVFESLLGWPGDQRLERAAEACGDDAELLVAVQRMIAMDASAAALIPTAPPERMQVIEQLLDPPTRFGNYRVDGLLGRGGMGEVWRGVRDDGVFDQQVAIKTIWPGLMGADAAHWFDAERRILARLQHPAVAQILDGGTDDKGRAYFVMELVEGQPIDEHVRQQSPGRRQTLLLMIEVCRALEYAHRQLVVHADLKPSNVWVNAEGRPKLLDFGISRLLSEEGRHWAVASSNSRAPLTRAYASPQRQGGALPGISDDLYSLGVILGELLGPQGDADLAAILAKATDPDAEQRYGAVTEFREDLQRFLAGYPVQARGRAWNYVAQRFIARHRLGVALATLAVLALFSATVLMTVLYARAEAARRDSVQRFEEVRALAKYMLFDLDVRLETTPGTTETRREMTGRSQAYLDALAQSAGSDDSLQQEVAAGLSRLAEVQGVPGRAHVGEPAAARANLERAEQMLVALRSRHPQSVTLQGDLGRVRYLLALVYGGQDNDLDRQLAKAREAEMDLAAAVSPSPEWRENLPALAELHAMLLGARLTQADALSSRDDFSAAAQLQRSEEERLQALPRELQLAMDFDYHSGRPAVMLGDSLYYLNQLEQAVAAYRRAGSRFEAGLQRQPMHRRLLNAAGLAAWSEGGTLDELGRYDEALAALDRGQAISQRLRDIDPENHEAQRQHETVRSQRAMTLGHLGRYDEAIALIEQGLAERHARARLAPEDAERVRDTVVPLRNLAALLNDRGDKAGACRVLRQAEQGWLDIGKRFGLSPRDQRTELETIQGELSRCNSR